MTAATDTTLVIAGHGSGVTPETARSTLLHAQLIRDRNLFAEVKTVFWRQDPLFDQAARIADPQNAILVPHFIGPGLIIDEKLPQMSGFPAHRIAPPVGLHPDFADLLRKHILARIADPANTDILLVGHGSSKRPRGGSFSITTRIAGGMDNGTFNSVRGAFLEEAPYASDWHKLTTAPHVAVVPLMISNGNHGAVDIPEALSLDPGCDHIAKAIETGTPAGPFDIAGRKVTWFRAIGIEAFISDLMIDLALSTLKDASAGIPIKRLA